MAMRLRELGKKKKKAKQTKKPITETKAPRKKDLSRRQGHR